MSLDLGNAMALTISYPPLNCTASVYFQLICSDGINGSFSDAILLAFPTLFTNSINFIEVLVVFGMSNLATLKSFPNFETDNSALQFKQRFGSTHCRIFNQYGSYFVEVCSQLWHRFHHSKQWKFNDMRCIRDKFGKEQSTLWLS